MVMLTLSYPKDNVRTINVTNGQNMKGLRFKCSRPLSAVLTQVKESKLTVKELYVYQDFVFKVLPNALHHKHTGITVLPEEFANQLGWLNGIY